MSQAKPLLLSLAISSALATTSFAAYAEQQVSDNELANQQENNSQLEVITVTSQKRTENLQSVPVSVQAIYGDAISQKNVARLQDLSDNMPNVTIAKSSTNARVYIRGIGTDSNGGFEQSVAMFNDGIYMGRGQQSKFPFIDVERVEVIKGPQGTLFGKNATAGAISIVSKDPSDEFESEVRLTVGEHGEQSRNLMISSPLTDTFAARVALFSRDMDGYMHNTALDRDEEDREEFGARSTFVWTPSDDFSANLKWETGEFKTKGSNYQVTYDPMAKDGLEPLMGEGDLDFTSSMANEGLLGGGPVKNKTTLNNLRLAIDTSLWGHSLNLITGYSQYEWDNAIDADFSQLSIAYQDRDEEFSQFSQEIRLLSPLDEQYDYIVGAYYQTSDLDIDVYTVADATLLGAPITAGGFEEFRQESDSFAVFGQFNWHLSKELTTTFGLRWGTEDKDVTADMITGLYDLTPDATGSFVLSRLGGKAHNLDESRSESKTSPMVRVAWTPSDDVMYYASISRGYKGGGFDASGLNSSEGSTPNDSFEFEEEKVTAAEIGGKLSLFSGSAMLNWAAYRSEYEDLQVSTYNGTGFIIGNAAKAIVQGLETDYRWAMSEDFTLNINAAYLDFEYDDFENAPCTVAQETAWAGEGECEQDLTGKEGALTPEFTASTSLKYMTEITSELELSADFSVNYSSDYNTESDLDNNLEQDSFTKLNLFVAISDIEQTWELAVIGKNLSDEKISTAGNDNPLIDFAYRRYLEMPRQWSVQGTYRF